MRLPEGAPTSSPWGKIDGASALCDGVFWVSTSSHGGIMVRGDLALKLTSAARCLDAHRFGGRMTDPRDFSQGWECYEGDCEWAIVHFEALEGRLGEEIRQAILNAHPRSEGDVRRHVVGMVRRWCKVYVEHRAAIGLPIPEEEAA